MKKRVLSLFMALALCFSMLPTAALATENTTEPSTQLTETTSVPEEPEEPETPDQPEETKTPDQGEETKTPDQGEDTKTPDQGEDTKTPDPSEEPPQDEEPPAAEEVAPVGAMLSAAATTGEEHTHYLCGGDTCNKVGHADEGTATTFQPWDGSNTNGAFYLTKDWTLTSTITVPKGSSLTLCLNGHSITLGSQSHNVDSGSYDVFLVQRRATFTLCDCKDKNGNYGTIGHYNPTENQGPGVNVAGTFNMYGGKIFQNQVKSYDGNRRGYGGGVLVSRTGTFNMFGGEITGNTAKSGGGVYVDGMFSMSGGTIYDNAGERGGGVYVTPYGIFNMSGSAAITGNTGTYGGVYVEGTFSMSGGTICGNTESSGGGVYVDYSGTFNMSGSAAITGNTVTGDGGGVYVRDIAKKMNVSGDVKIENNWKGGTLNAGTGLYEKGNGSANNLCLGTDKYVIITGDGGLGKNARIGVTTAKAPTSNGNILIATGATKELSYYTNIFTPDVQNQGCVIAKNEDNLSVHQHSWGYTANGATITATCRVSGCPNPHGGSVTIAAPTELTYNGSGKAAVVTASGDDWQGPAVKDISIGYTKTGKQGQEKLENSALPTNAGTYTASITLGGQTASVTYEIGKATPMAKDFVFAAPGNLNYDGNSKIVTVSSTKISVDDVTVKYYQGDKQVENPTNAGDYTVKIDVAESTNYAAVNDLMADGWKFTIAKNTTTPDVTLSGDMVYKKNKIEPTVTVTVDGKTLTKDKDYEVTYGDNMNAGKNAGTVTITAKGNYDFTQIVKMFDITAQIIQVTAENKSSRVGQDIVELTYTHADGLPYEGDTFSGKLETTADKDKAGTYGITKGTLTLGSNYNIVFTPGTYTVEDKLPQDSFAFKDVVDGKVTKTYGDADFTVAATDEAEGSSVSYESTNTNVATVDSTGKVTIHAAGTTTIKATAHETKDYAEKKIFYTLTVKPKTLTKDDLTYSGPITKVYDTNTNAPTGLTVSVKSGSLVGSDTLAVTGMLKYNSANVNEANKITFTPDAITTGNYALAASEVLTITGAKITQATPTYTVPTGLTAKYGQTLADVNIAATTGWSWMNTGTAVGTPATKNFPAKFTPTDAINYKTVENIDVSVAVSKATAPTLADIPVSQKYTVTTEQSKDIGRAGMPEDAGNLTYTAGSSSVTTGTATVSSFTVDNTGMVKYTITGGTNGAIINLPVTIGSDNYADATVNVVITLTAKDDQAALTLTGGTTVVYGQTLQLGTSGGSGTGAVTYAVTNGTGEATIDATGKLTPVKVGIVKVKATKAEDANYNALTSAEVEITITRATPTGAPKYTAITTSGKTLADAGLTITGSTLNPNAGTLVWVDNAGNVLPDTTAVAANTTYKWLFTPTDTNYTTLTGSIELYHKSSSGGGGWYYTYHTIKATAGTNGSISPSGWTSVRDGRDQTFTITPDKGYAVANVLVDGKSVGAVKSYTFKNVTKDHTIEAIFMKSNGNPQTGVFVDVAEGSYYEEAIDWAVEKGITNGVSSNMFAPNDPCTRAQIVTFLWRAAGSPAPKSMSSFTDVPADAFYAKAVAWAVENGITSGTGEGKFSPNSTCTRAQAVTFLYRASGSPAVSGKAEFSDVSTTAFYADAVAWAAKKGITTGIGGGLFGSDNDCTRGQIVTFLWRAMAE